MDIDRRSHGSVPVDSAICDVDALVFDIGANWTVLFSLAGPCLHLFIGNS